MVTVQQISELKKMVRAAKKAGKRVGFVPTMGYFHEGHLSLMHRAKQENEMVVVSLFVNPTQFGPGEDYQSYPRDLERDHKMAAEAGVDIIFVPEVSEMYRPNFQTFVEVTEVSQGLCGNSRPAHFRGVTTVVIKLFNIVEPDCAYFGEKDAQQLRVIRQMARDLNLNIEIIGCPIVREPDGLAMSSRNVYLNQDERQAALILYKTLLTAEEFIKAGWNDAVKLQQELVNFIRQEPMAKLDYLVIAENETLKPVCMLEGEIIIALAVKIGKTRLIDNRVFTIN